MGESMYQKPVTRGIAWLEEHHPGWREKITPAALDMGDCSLCVLGQVFSDWAAGQEAGVEGFDFIFGRDCTDCVGIEHPMWDWAESHGFNAFEDDDDDACYENLRAEWIRQLSEAPESLPLANAAQEPNTSALHGHHADNAATTQKDEVAP